MGILDGYPLDPGADGGAAPPGWLGLALGAPVAAALPPANAMRPHLAPPIDLALAFARTGVKRALPPANYLAAGVKRIDSRLAGEKFLAQFSPEVQAAVKALLDGRAVPDTNQRPGFAQAITAIARKYGQASGPLPDARPEPVVPTSNPTE